MKAIYEFDAPETCAKCELLKIHHNGLPYCISGILGFDILTFADKRADDCPLRIVDDGKEMTGHMVLISGTRIAITDEHLLKSGRFLSKEEHGGVGSLSFAEVDPASVEPVAVKVLRKNDWVVEEAIGLLGDCPNCETTLGSVSPYIPHRWCPHCGQRLDWQ